MLKDPIKTKENIVQWIREHFENNIPGASAIVGISGGKDSSVTAALCVEALGADRVIGVTMPDGAQSDINDSYTLIDHLGIQKIEINIGEITSAFKNTFLQAEDFKNAAGKNGLEGEAAINMPPRIRMAVLYAVAQSVPGGAMVANTCNASEDYVGYSTKYGDAAGDFSPLQNLTVEEVLQVGAVLGLPESLVSKTPSDGLSGKSDEDKLGFKYADLDRYIATGICEDEALKNRIDTLHKRNLHKLLPMPAYKKGADE